MSPSTLNIEDLTSSGEGVGTVDGKKIFVEGALPHEQVEVEITLTKKRYAKAKLLKILKASPYRIDPICPLFGICGGCQIMHLDYPEQLKWKTSRVKNTLLRIAKISPSISPCAPSPDQLHYRNKIHLHKGGFHKRHSHEIVPINRCYIHNKTGEKSLPQAKKCREAIIKTSLATDETMLICSGKPDRPFLIEKLADLEFKVGPNDFFQVNPKQALRMYNRAIECAELNSTARVLDAYCGVGCLTLLAAQKAKTVIGIESGREAIKHAEENAQRNSISNTAFYCAQVEDKIPSLGTFDTIFLNPPRGGVDPQVLSTICAHPPKRLIYISCDPATLARDLSQLKDLFKIEAVLPFDMFPQTTHVETLVSLTTNK